jgi:hypothetical protein
MKRDAILEVLSRQRKIVLPSATLQKGDGKRSFEGAYLFEYDLEGKLRSEFTSLDPNCVHEILQNWPKPGEIIPHDFQYSVTGMCVDGSELSTHPFVLTFNGGGSGFVAAASPEEIRLTLTGPTNLGLLPVPKTPGWVF